MPSKETKKIKKLGMQEEFRMDGQTKRQHSYRELKQERLCQKVLRKKFCSDYVDVKLKLHFAPKTTEKIITKGAAAGGAITAALVATGAGAFAAAASAVATLLATIFLETAKNHDGSLDVYVSNDSYEIDGKKIYDTTAALVLRVFRP